MNSELRALSHAMGRVIGFHGIGAFRADLKGGVGTGERVKPPQS